MRLLSCLIVLIFSSVTFSNEAQVGVIIGSMAGISGKYDLGADRALDGAISYSTDSKYGTSFFIDYLINKARRFSVGQMSPVHFFYGLGLRVLSIRSGRDSGHSRLGVRAPLGVNYQVSNPDLEFFGEIAPTLDITPSTDVYFDVGLGVRIRF